MAVRQHVIEVRNAGAQTLVDQTGGPWTDISFAAANVLPTIPGITLSGNSLTVSATGTYLATYFIAIDHATGDWPSDTIFMCRAIVNGSVVPAQSYACAGHYTAYGRNGVGLSFLLELNSGDAVKLQYRVHQNQINYPATPLPRIGGTTGTATGHALGPGGPAVSTFGLEWVQEDEVEYPALISYRLSNNLPPAVSANTWYDINWASYGAVLSREYFALANLATFTIPETGYYLVGYQLAPDMVSTTALSNARMRARLTKNGSDIIRSNGSLSVHTTLGWNSLQHTFIEHFTAGDQVKMQYQQTLTGAQWTVGGWGSAATFREYVTSIFFLKVSDHLAIAATNINNGLHANGTHGLEQATVAPEGLPSVAWSETHSDAGPPNVQWHVSNNRFLAPATRSLRYAEDAANNYNAGGVTNNGTCTTPTVTLPNNPAGGRYGRIWLEFDYYRHTEGGEHYDRFSVEVWQGGVLEATFQPLYPATAVTGITPVQQAWAHFKQPLPRTLTGKTIFLKFHFNTIDSSGNTYEGQYLCNIHFWGEK